MRHQAVRRTTPRLVQVRRMGEENDPAKHPTPSPRRSGKKFSISFKTDNVDQDSDGPGPLRDVQEFWYNTVAARVAKTIELDPNL